MTNDFPEPFARQYETHLKHLNGQATKFGIDDGDGRVSHGDRKDGAPTGATAALGLKLPQHRVSTAEFAGSARFER